MIEIYQLSKVYGDVVAVRDLSLKVERGEIFGLLGPNGAGKSTTVKILTGLLKPTSGMISIAGLDVTAEPLEVKRRTGYVPENAILYESLTADEYIQLVGDLRGIDPVKLQSSRDELFALFGLLETDRTKLLSEFSKGMKQKVLIVAALIHNPDLLILDEPLSGLDASAALIIKELVRKLAHSGKTVFFCSHVLETVERLCDRIAILHRGELIALGTPAEINEMSGESTLELSFNKLTGGGDAEVSAESMMRALQ